jgi:hypothetical protein
MVALFRSEISNADKMPLLVAFLCRAVKFVDSADIVGSTIVLVESGVLEYVHGKAHAIPLLSAFVCVVVFPTTYKNGSYSRIQHNGGSFMYSRGVLNVGVL